MASEDSGRRSLKRKTCESNEKDDNQDDEKNEATPVKIPKIDDSDKNNVQDSNLETRNEENCLKIMNSVELSSIKVDNTTNEPTILPGNITNLPESKTTTMTNDEDCIVIEDFANRSKVDSSVQIIEVPIPLVEVSDDEEVVVLDDKIEEGEILASFEVVDEIGPTPMKETEENFDDSKEDDIDDPIIFMNFKDDETKNTYGIPLMKFLKTYTELEITIDDLCVTVKKTSSLDISKNKKKRNRRKKAKKELFVVDTNPTFETNQVLDVKYQKKFSIEEDKAENDVKTTPQSQHCFNCSQDHSLRDCTIPKDFNRINTARQKFNSSRHKLTRYHEDKDQKYAHLKPGKISGELRKALGLRKNELPGYIYGMRVLGYPPGWLEEAKISNSSLRIFNIDGDKVKSTKRKKGLDSDKIIEYPGYNAPLTKGFHDDFRKYNVMPYSNYRKENMIRDFEYLVKETNSDTSDMDLDENADIKDQSVTVKQIVKNETKHSLVDLEQQKEKLLNELNAANCEDKKEQQRETPSTPSNNNNNDKKGTDQEDVKSESVIAVKNSTLGTPILKSSSPYSRLPNPDNFMVGVSPVINFENLPNSTGKYEQMSDVLNKVRNTLKYEETS